jgi:O-antigen/teichoic acid export membrane protein
MRAGLRGALLSSSGVFGSALCWVLSFKVLAYWLGPEGVGLFAQLRQLAQTATLGATYGGTNVVVQGLSVRNDEGSRRQFRAMAARLIGFAGLGVVLLMLTGAPLITQFILSSDAPELISAMRWLALAVLLNIVATYMLAVLNGYRSHVYLAIAQVAGPALLSLFLVAAWLGMPIPSTFALVGAFVLCFGMTCLVGAWGVSRLPEREAGKQAVSLPAHQQAREFMGFALSSLIAALSSVAVLLVIRSWIIEAKGLAFSGLFDAGWTLTFNYTTLFLTACNMMYLPMLAAATSIEQQKATMLKAAYLVLGISLLMGYAMVLWQGPLIHLFYNSQFEASGPVLSILVIAVVFRGISWTYGTMMLATRKSGVLLVSDLALSAALLVTTRYALDNEGTLEALGWAFVLPHFLYLAFVIEYVRLKNPLMHRRHIWPLLGAGSAPLVYLALMSSDLHWSISSPEKMFYMAIGLATSLMAYVAFRKVAP